MLRGENIGYQPTIPEGDYRSNLENSGNQGTGDAVPDSAADLALEPMPVLAKPKPPEDVVINGLVERGNTLEVPVARNEIPPAPLPLPQKKPPDTIIPRRSKNSGAQFEPMPQIVVEEEQLPKSLEENLAVLLNKAQDDTFKKIYNKYNAVSYVEKQQKLLATQELLSYIQKLKFDTQDGDEDLRVSRINTKEQLANAISRLAQDIESGAGGVEEVDTVVAGDTKRADTVVAGGAKVIEINRLAQDIESGAGGVEEVDTVVAEGPEVIEINRSEQDVMADILAKALESRFRFGRTEHGGSIDGVFVPPDRLDTESREMLSTEEVREVINKTINSIGLLLKLENKNNISEIITACGSFAEYIYWKGGKRNKMINDIIRGTSIENKIPGDADFAVRNRKDLDSVVEGISNIVKENKQVFESMGVKNFEVELVGGEHEGKRIGIDQLHNVPKDEIYSEFPGEPDTEEPCYRFGFYVVYDFDGKEIEVPCEIFSNTWVAPPSVWNEGGISRESIVPTMSINSLIESYGRIRGFEHSVEVVTQNALNGLVEPLTFSVGGVEKNIRFMDMLDVLSEKNPKERLEELLGEPIFVEPAEGVIVEFLRAVSEDLYSKLNQKISGYCLEWGMTPKDLLMAYKGFREYFSNGEVPQLRELGKQEKDKLIKLLTGFKSKLQQRFESLDRLRKLSHLSESSEEYIEQLKEKKESLLGLVELSLTSLRNVFDKAGHVFGSELAKKAQEEVRDGKKLNNLSELYQTLDSVREVTPEFAEWADNLNNFMEFSKSVA